MSGQWKHAGMSELREAGVLFVQWRCRLDWALMKAKGTGAAARTGRLPWLGKDAKPLAVTGSSEEKTLGGTDGGRGAAAPAPPTMGVPGIPSAVSR